MSVRQYIGARYVPIFYEGSNGSQWDSGVRYDALTLVEYLGNTFCSKKNVPSTVGAPNVNPDYWANVGMSGSVVSDVAQLKVDVDNLENWQTEAQNDIDDLKETVASNDKAYIFISDSYGLNPSVNNSWITNLISMFNIETHYESSISGAGFWVNGGNSFLSALAGITVEDASKITDVVVCGGYNDMAQANLDATALDAAISNFVTYVHNNFPNATVRIGFIGAFCPGSDRPTLNFSKYHSALQVYKNSQKYGAVYLNGVEQIMHNKSLLLTDYIHPNANGARELASFIGSAIFTGCCEYISNYTSILATPLVGTFNGSNANANIGSANIDGESVSIHLNDITMAGLNAKAIGNDFAEMATLNCDTTYFSTPYIINTMAFVHSNIKTDYINAPIQIKLQENKMYVRSLYINGPTFETHTFDIIIVPSFDFNFKTIMS